MRWSPTRSSRSDERGLRSPRARRRGRGAGRGAAALLALLALGVFAPAAFARGSRGGKPAAPANAERVASGTLTYVDTVSNAVSVATGGDDRVFLLDSATRVLRGDAAAKLADLAPGERVTVIWRPSLGARVALEIRAAK